LKGRSTDENKAELMETRGEDKRRIAELVATKAYFLGANDPYSALKTTLKAEINEEAWASLHSARSRNFTRPSTGRIAVKVINHLGDEVMKVMRVN